VVGGETERDGGMDDGIGVGKTGGRALGKRKDGDNDRREKIESSGSGRNDVAGTQSGRVGEVPPTTAYPASDGDGTIGAIGLFQHDAPSTAVIPPYQLGRTTPIPPSSTAITTSHPVRTMVTDPSSSSSSRSTDHLTLNLSRGLGNAIHHRL
jgi:hypothetical protein